MANYKDTNIDARTLVFASSQGWIIIPTKLLPTQLTAIRSGYY